MEKNKDIGKRYGIKEGTVAVILTRCREKLREHLGKEGIEI